MSFILKLLKSDSDNKSDILQVYNLLIIYVF